NFLTRWMAICVLQFHLLARMVIESIRSSSCEISCRRNLCLADYRSGRARTSVFLVRFDPVGGYLALGGLQIQLAGAYELLELPLKGIFHIGVPRRSFG